VPAALPEGEQAQAPSWQADKTTSFLSTRPAINVAASEATNNKTTAAAATVFGTKFKRLKLGII
jgi:hypothetical protein